MERFRYLVLSLLFIVLAVMPPVFAQEEVVEEAAVEEEAVWGDESATEEVAPAETAQLPAPSWGINLGFGASLMSGEFVTTSPSGLGVPLNAFMPDLPVFVTVGGMANILTKVTENAPGNTYTGMGFLMVGMPLGN